MYSEKGGNFISTSGDFLPSLNTLCERPDSIKDYGFRAKALNLEQARVLLSILKEKKKDQDRIFRRFLSNNGYYGRNTKNN
jgi:hypothetical protein